VKIGIVAHTNRLDLANRLADDVDPDFVSFDDGTAGCRRNHLNVWQYLAKSVDDDEWAIVLEDDAKPVLDFRRHAQAALDAAPTDVVSLYLGKLRPPQWMKERVPQAIARANRDNAHWITGDYMLHAVGVALRGRELVEKFLWATKDFRRPPDEMFSMWCRNYGHRLAYTWPSIVDHLDEPPAIEVHTDGEIRDRGRVAWRFGMRDNWNSRGAELKSP
jgi:GR25 family glycosyltransferase involved in LPS biosynthesis